SSDSPGKHKFGIMLDSPKRISEYDRLEAEIAGESNAVNYCLLLGRIQVTDKWTWGKKYLIQIAASLRLPRLPFKISFRHNGVGRRLLYRRLQACMSLFAHMSIDRAQI
ncbi:MAG TPA: hypothetical protein VJ044_16350, partial [Candidatus Hodarchaeales archaeon]|nr:hypothetical protein [Candidatus Hodarchaeales archaeon]